MNENEDKRAELSWDLIPEDIEPEIRGSVPWCQGACVYLTGGREGVRCALTCQQEGVCTPAVASMAGKLADERKRVEVLTEAVKAWQVEVRRLEHIVDGDPEADQTDKSAAEKALDDIAEACGCPEWHYPGQVVRDVLGLAEALRDAQESKTYHEIGGEGEG